MPSVVDLGQPESIGPHIVDAFLGLLVEGNSFGLERGDGCRDGLLPT